MENSVRIKMGTLTTKSNSKLPIRALPKKKKMKNCRSFLRTQTATTRTTTKSTTIYLSAPESA